MRGSLSDPPIVYTQGRIWLFLLFAVMAVFAYKFLPLSTDLLFATLKRPPSSFGLRATIAAVIFVLLAVDAFMAATAIYSVLRIISPGTLTLAPDGLTYQVGSRVSRYDWRLVTNARIESGPRGSQWIVFDYPDADTPTGFWRLHKKLSEDSIGLGGNWGASNSEIADTINEARAKWYKGRD